MFQQTGEFRLYFDPGEFRSRPNTSYWETAMSRLSLDTIHIATPCNVSWETMTGDDQVRFCHDCKRRVYNLSEMTRQDAQELIERKEGRLCIRLYRRADGTLITQDCPVGVSKWVRRGARRIAAALLFALCFLGYVHLSRTPNSTGSRILREVEPFKTVFGWLLPPQPLFNTVAMGGIGCKTGAPAEPAIDKQPENE
jgi:hypothetical protein